MDFLAVILNIAILTGFLSKPYLYLSSVEYLKKKKIKSLVFISRNFNDFSDPNNSQTDLHPDLVSNDLVIEYYLQIGRCISELKKELGVSYVKEDDNDIDYTKRFQLLSDIGHYKLIDQINLTLECHYKEIPFIPTHILSRISPFKISNWKYPYAYHSSFQLNSNNDELLSFFKSCKIGKNNSIQFNNKELASSTKNSKEKVLSILQKLNQNLIYDVSGIGNDEHVNIQLKGGHDCQCVRCSYNRLDFHKAYTLLKGQPQEDDRDTIKQAYIHFQFGDFPTALKLFYHVFINSENQGKVILSFICLQNLKRVTQHLNEYVTATDQLATEIIEEVNKLSLKKAKLAASSLKSPFIDEVIEWISEDKYFYETLKNLSATLEKIRDHFYSQLSGGISSNSNFHILISQFAEIDQFLDRNFIIFNTYSEFESLIDKFTEGLFMIYSFNKHQSTRIDFINEYLLLKIATFGKRETIIKYYKRTNLLSLKFGTGTSKKVQFEQVALTFFSAYWELKTRDTKRELRNHLFWDKYRRIFNNILLMLTLSSEKNDLTAITNELMRILEDGSFTMQLEVTSIADFINYKGKYISDDLFQKFISLCVRNQNLHEAKIFWAISKQIKNYHKKLLINNPEVFADVKLQFLGECPQCTRSYHTDILVHIIPILTDTFKIEIQKIIISALNKEFKPDVYYTLSMSDVIDFSIWFEQFYALCLPPPKPNTTPRHPFSKTEAFLYRLNEVLNLAFKNGVDLDTEKYHIFKGISLYYDWILDLEGFDYKKFDPLWILEYQTHYYLNKIFASKKLKKHLQVFLKSNKHPFLNELYIQYATT